MKFGIKTVVGTTKEEHCWLNATKLRSSVCIEDTLRSFNSRTTFASEEFNNAVQTQFERNLTNGNTKTL